MCAFLVPDTTRNEVGGDTSRSSNLACRGLDAETSTANHSCRSAHAVAQYIALQVFRGGALVGATFQSTFRADAVTLELDWEQSEPEVEPIRFAPVQLYENEREDLIMLAHQQYKELFKNVRFAQANGFATNVRAFARTTRATVCAETKIHATIPELVDVFLGDRTNAAIGRAAVDDEDRSQQESQELAQPRAPHPAAMLYCRSGGDIASAETAVSVLRDSGAKEARPHLRTLRGRLPGSDQPPAGAHATLQWVVALGQPRRQARPEVLQRVRTAEIEA
ncbi:hypothetical protein ON010_g2257 [Phytophthora cinnamomi]|nr:hypothetical protein ON010_g2257 [Phytophthora cinnamomi]